MHDFEVEYASGCMWDSVSIFDGEEQHSPLLAKLCGSTIPEPVETTGNLMYVNFISDQYIGKHGFNCKISTTTPASGLEGTTTSVNIMKDSTSAPSITEMTPPEMASIEEMTLATEMTLASESPSLTEMKSSKVVTSSTEMTSQAEIASPTKNASSTKMTLSTEIISVTKATSTTESLPLSLDVCASAEIHVHNGIYLLSPGKEINSNYPVNIHCSLQVSTETNKVRCYYIIL